MARSGTTEKLEGWLEHTPALGTERSRSSCTLHPLNNLHTCIRDRMALWIYADVCPHADCRDWKDAGLLQDPCIAPQRPPDHRQVQLARAREASEKGVEAISNPMALCW